MPETGGKLHVETREAAHRPDGFTVTAAVNLEVSVGAAASRTGL
jgi:hypothetical protein